MSEPKTQKSDIALEDWWADLSLSSFFVETSLFFSHPFVSTNEVAKAKDGAKRWWASYLENVS